MSGRLSTSNVPSKMTLADSYARFMAATLLARAVEPSSGNSSERRRSDSEIATGCSAVAG